MKRVREPVGSEELQAPLILRPGPAVGDDLPAGDELVELLAGVRVDRAVGRELDLADPLEWSDSLGRAVGETEQEDAVRIGRRQPAADRPERQRRQRACL